MYTDRFCFDDLAVYAPLNCPAFRSPTRPESSVCWSNSNNSSSFLGSLHCASAVSSVWQQFTFDNDPWHCPGFAGCPVPDARNHRLPLAFFAGMLVLIASTEIRLVCFNGTGQHIRLCQGSPCLPDPVQRKPCRFLFHAQIAAQLHAGYALGTCGRKVDGYGPFTVADLGARRGGTGLDAKVLFAFRAIGISGCFATQVRSDQQSGQTRPFGHTFSPNRSMAALIVGKHVERLFRRMISAHMLLDVTFYVWLVVHIKAVQK